MTRDGRLAIGGADGGLTYAELAAASRRGASGLLHGGADLDDARVAFLETPGCDYVAVQQGIWAAGGDGVHCYDPDGTLIGKLELPEVASNLTFGGPQRNRLFVTATTSLYSIRLTVNGAILNSTS